MRNVMRPSLFIGLILFFCLGTASAGQFGAPEPAETSQYVSVGGGYFYNADKWELKTNLKEYKFSQNQIYLQLGVTLNNMEFYIRGGGADLAFENAFGTGDFDDDFRPFGTIGVKGLIDINSYFDIGLFAQGSLYSTFKSQATGLIGGVSATQEIEIKDLTEGYVGLMLQCKVSNVRVYGGPFLYLTHANVEAAVTALGVRTSSSNSFKEPNNFGGALGIKIPVSQGINIEFEGQYRQAFSGGGCITY
jgi:hypothetical protein